MILSFANKETEDFFKERHSKKIPPSIQRNALRKLLILHAATSLGDLTAPPGNRLEALKGTKKKYYSIRINDQWRLCFHWNQGNATEVQIVDYH
jgi:proteic killer suppression protein